MEQSQATGGKGRPAVGETREAAGRASRGMRVMRNRWIMAALVATAGLLASPAAERAHAQATAWDMSGNEERPLWAPVGTYQHDGSGIYTGIELVYLSQQRTVGEQIIALRGFAQNFLGGWVGSREVALSSEDLGRASWGAGYRATLGYRMENGWNFSLSWLHLFDVKYTGGAGTLARASTCTHAADAASEHSRLFVRCERLGFRRRGARRVSQRSCGSRSRRYDL